MPRLTRKRRTREHIIADLSVHHVEGHVLRCGWIVERTTHDYGIDLLLITFNRNGEFEEDWVLLQIKASDRLRIRRGQRTLSFRIDRRDLVHWLGQLMPVILIVYDARRDVAYWLYVQNYFRRLKGFKLFSVGKSVTVRVPTGQVLDTAAVRKFRHFRDRIRAQIPEAGHDGDATDSIP
jgi:hypothetical protein